MKKSQVSKSRDMNISRLYETILADLEERNYSKVTINHFKFVCKEFMQYTKKKGFRIFHMNWV